jgi:hypothetical protein
MFAAAHHKGYSVLIAYPYEFLSEQYIGFTVIEILSLIQCFLCKMERKEGPMQYC